MLLLISGPLILFSSLNPDAQFNHVTAASVKFNVEVDTDESDSVNSYTLFESSKVLRLHHVTEEDYHHFNFKRDAELRNLDTSLMQVVRMAEHSSTGWYVTPPSLDALQRIFNGASGNNTAIKHKLNVKLYYSFDRPVIAINDSLITYLFLGPSRKAKCSDELGV